MPLKPGLIQAAITEGEPRALVNVRDVTATMVTDVDELVSYILAEIL